MTEQSSALKPMGNIHHLALRCRDAEQTRWFYEDVLGLKLAGGIQDGDLFNRYLLQLFAVIEL